MHERIWCVRVYACVLASVLVCVCVHMNYRSFKTNCVIGGLVKF